MVRHSNSITFSCRSVQQIGEADIRVHETESGACRDVRDRLGL
jgi:hypothetical protein